MKRRTDIPQSDVWDGRPGHDDHRHSPAVSIAVAVGAIFLLGVAVGIVVGRAWR